MCWGQRPEEGVQREGLETPGLCLKGAVWGPEDCAPKMAQRIVFFRKFYCLPQCTSGRLLL